MTRLALKIQTLEDQGNLNCSYVQKTQLGVEGSYMHLQLKQQELGMKEKELLFDHLL